MFNYIHAKYYVPKIRKKKETKYHDKIYVPKSKFDETVL